MPVYNAERWIGQCIESIISQDYPYFDLIVIDDCSTDLTWEYIKYYDIYSIRNKERKGALANIVNGIDRIGSDIIVTVDGDDYLPDNKVFSYLESFYTSDIWMTYGSFLPVSLKYKNTCQPFDKIRVPCEAGYLVDTSTTPEAYRKSGLWVTSHLRTFRKWLWDRIDPDDLKEDGQYYDVACDLAFMYPMIEMAGDHCKFIDRIMYMYNDLNPNCNGTVKKDQQLETAKRIQEKQCYARVDGNIL